MKTKLTLEMEEALYYYCREQGDVVVEEVTMPADRGIVDTLSCRFLADGSLEWRCYELKVTKADFYSQAKLSFVGHYNYFVLPFALFEKVKEDIPSNVGVMLYRSFEQADTELAAGSLMIVKKPQRKELEVDSGALTQRFIASQAREVGKAKKVAKGLGGYHLEELYKELKRRQTDYDLYGGETNYYERFLEDTQIEAVEALREELDSLRVEYTELKERQRGTCISEPFE